MMVIGLKYGKDKPDDEAAKEKTYRTVREFLLRFEKRHGTTICRELINADISTPESLTAARNKGLFTTTCPPFVKSAAEILEELLYSIRAVSHARSFLSLEAAEGTEEELTELERILF